MKKYKKHLFKTLSALLIFLTIILIWIILYQTHQTKEYLFSEINSGLSTSVRKYIEDKAQHVYYAVRYSYDPQKGKIGEYETRKARYADTTFTYQSLIVDPGTAAFRGYQTVFLETGQLHVDSIQIILDSILQEKNIRVQSIVGVTSSFRKKINKWSNDTTNMSINYRTTFPKQGNYEHINYFAYIHYSPETIWTLISKPPIYTLFLCSIIVGFILLWWKRKLNIKKINSIILLKNGNYRICNIEFLVNEKRLMSEEKETKLATQLYDLLLLLLSTTDYRVSKVEIKQKFWPSTMDPTSNMTSAVNRLNKVLKDINCIYTIVSDPQNEEYYILSKL